MIVGYNQHGELIMHVDPVNGICIGGCFQPEHMRSRAQRSEIFDETQTFGENGMGYDEPITVADASRGTGIPSLLEGIEQKHVLMPTREQAGYVPQTKQTRNILQ
jgi:hypothetical protein